MTFFYPYSMTIYSKFFAQGLKKAKFENVQIFDFEGLKGRMLSASYMPSESDASFAALIDELNALFAKHAENGKIRILYDTNLFCSQM